MATMIAGLHDGIGTVQVKEIDKPVPEPGDALICVKGSGICG